MSEPTRESGRGGGRWSDHEVEQLVGRLLQAGVLVAAAVTILGAVLLLAREGGAPIDFGTLRPPTAGLHTVRGVLAGALALEPHAIVQLGLVLLVATPVARVALTLVAFAMQRDRLYVAITLLVLALLVYGLAGGKVH